MAYSHSSYWYFFQLVYVCLCLIRWSRPVYSQVGVGAAGVLLQILALTAGLGICAVLGLHFNAATTQVWIMSYILKMFNDMQIDVYRDRFNQSILELESLVLLQIFLLLNWLKYFCISDNSICFPCPGPS